MSADDFQSKYASVMESMLKSAVAETTKLFETMVDDLKAEISRIKKENEDLKTRCSQFEKWKSQSTVHICQSEPPPRPSDSTGKRDTAVQCDLVPFRTMLVEQCEPSRKVSLQNQQQQRSNEEMEYGLHRHNSETHEAGNSEMDFILVKQEGSYVDSSLQSVWKQEEVETTVICGQASDAGSPPSSVCGFENEGPLITQTCTTGEMPAKDEEAQVSLEQPCLGVDSNLQERQNILSELEHSLVITLAAIKDNTEDLTGGQHITSEEESFVTAQQQSVHEKEELSLPPQHCKRESEISVNGQNDLTLQNTDLHSAREWPAKLGPQNKNVVREEPKNGTEEVEANSQPLRRRRGRPPKKLKCVPQSVKEICEPLTTDVTTAQEMINSPSVTVEELEVPSTVDTVNTTASESPQAFSVEPKNISSIINSSVQERSNTAFGDAENGKIGSKRRFSFEKKNTSESEQLSTEVDAPSTEDSSPTGTLKSSAAEPQQATAVQLRTRHTSVTLQDAMLLVEAMNRSTEENTSGSPNRMAAAPQTQCVSPVDNPQTVDKVPAEPQIPPLLTDTLEAAGIQSTTQSGVKTLCSSPQVTISSTISDGETHFKVVIPGRQNSVTPSSTTTPTIPSSTAATQRGARSQYHLPHPLITPGALSEPSNTIHHKIIVVPRLPSSLHHKIVALSPTQLSSFVSTVVAAQNKGILPASTAASLPPKTSSLSSVPRKTMYVASIKSPPVVPALSTATSTEQRSGILPQPNITILNQRQMSALEAEKVLSQPKSKKVALTAKQESAKPVTAVAVSSSQDVNVFEDAQTEVSTTSSQEGDDTTDNLESLEQTASVPESSNATTETYSSLKKRVPTELMPASVPPEEQKLCAVVKLTRLPFAVSTKESVLVSRVFSNECTKTQSILKVCTAQEMSEEQNDIQEPALLPLERCTMLRESYVDGYVRPSPKESTSVSEKMAVSVSTIELSIDKSPSNLEEEIITNTAEDCAPLNDTPAGGKQSAPLIQLTPIISKDISDPHLQMTKTQFLAQLAVSPIVQAPQTTSSDDSEDIQTSSAKTNTRLQEASLVARLRSHLKMHSQTRITETNPEPCRETDTVTVSSKRLGFEKDSSKFKDSASDSIATSPEMPVVLEGVPFPNSITNDHSHSSPRRTGLYKNAFRPKRSVSEPTSSSEATGESTTVSLRTCSSGRDGVGSKNIKSTSLMPRRSTKDVIPKKSKNGTGPKNTKYTSVSPKETNSTREDATIKKTESPAVSSGTSSLRENGRSLKMSTGDLISVNHRSMFTQDNCSNKQIKRESSPWRITGNTVAETKSETGSPSVGGTKKTEETTPAKKARLIQGGCGCKKNLRVLNAKKLAKAAKEKTIAKMKNSNQSKGQNGAKINQNQNQASSEAVRRFTAKAVWIPPRLPASKILAAGGKRLSLLPVKQETRSPRSQNHAVVYPPSVSLQPIPVKAPPIISPLQPLSVIGGRLLKNQCGECGRILSSSAALESHVSLHTGRRPFSCTLCGKSFTDSKGLKRHGRVHRNGRIHVCQQCGKGFVYRFGLTKHLQMVHGRIKPFVCQICNKGFFTKRDVEAHIRIHTGEKPFHCNLCDKKFTRRVELNVHLRWHNGEKRHWCPFCGKGFLDFNNLKRHKYIHTGEKPHSCPHCPKHFTQSGHLKKHVKNVHKV